MFLYYWGVRQLYFRWIYFDDEEHAYKFVTSKNGKQLLLLEGYSYRKYMTSRGNTSSSYWTCTKRGCRAKGNLAPSGVFTLTKNEHIHGPDFKEMKKKIVVAKLRQLALTTDFSHERLLRTFGIHSENESDRKYRAMINYWRWHAKRKRERADFPPMDLMPDSLDYSFVQIGNLHFLNFQNFLYRKYKTTRIDGCSYWKCRQSMCPSRVKINPGNALKVLIFRHDHPAEVNDECEPVGHDLKEHLRELVSTTDFDTKEILSMCGVEKNVHLKRYVTNLRVRKAKSDKNLEEIELDENDEDETDLVVKLPKDYLLLEDSNETGEPQTVVAVDSFFKVVDADGNEKTIVVDQNQEMEEFVGDPEDSNEYKGDLAAFYVSSDGDEHTFILNQ